MPSPSSEHPSPRPEQLQNLLGKARPQTSQDQLILLMGLADLYEDQTRTKPEAVTEVFVHLVREAEQTIRQLLAERLAQAEWAPRELVDLLVHDEIEVAREIILHSPLLTDLDLIELLQQASLDHQVHVAQRAGLGSSPIKHILSEARAPVLIALANNPTAQVDQDDMVRMLDLSQNLTALKPPLARHPALTQAVAMKLLPWVGESLQRSIQARFSLDITSLNRATAYAIEEAQGLALSADDEMAQRLIHKLHSADQLRPTYLVRAAREGRLNLFSFGLAALGGFPLEQVRRALNASSARPLFLACTAVGVDRAAFGSLLGLVQAMNQGLPQDPGTTAKSLAIRSKDQANLEFRTLMKSLDTSSI